MKYWLGLMLVAVVALAVPASADVIGNTDEAVRAIADPMLDSVLEGLKTGDYAKFSKDFDDGMKEALSKEKFVKTHQQIQQSMGNYKSREYLGFLNKGGYTIVLWKGRFDGTNDDILIKLVVSKRGGKYFVTGLWFQ